jgi:hypothetical protein
VVISFVRGGFLPLAIQRRSKTVVDAHGLRDLGENAIRTFQLSQNATTPSSPSSEPPYDFRGARSSFHSSLGLDLGGIGASSYFTKSDFEALTRLFGFYESLVELSSQTLTILSDLISEGFQGGSEVVPIDFGSIFFQLFHFSGISAITPM